MSPRSESQFEAMRQQSMHNISEAALELFAERGFKGASIAQIAKRAGVSKGLLYNYFDSKQALLHYIVLHSVETGEEMLEEVLSTVEEPTEQLRQFTERSIELLQKDLKPWRLLSSLAFQPDILNDLMPVLMEKQGAAMDKMKQVFEGLGYPDASGEMLLYSAAMDGLALQYMQAPEEYPMEQMKQLILNKFLPKGA
jgi:AcrR family transcriptional regulator